MNGIEHKAPTLVALAAALVMLVVTGLQAYDFWQREAVGKLVNTDVSVADSGSTTGLPEPGSELASVPLFGTPGEEQPVKSSQNGQPGKSTTGLQLRGALAATGRAPGTALIETEGGDTEAYREGDSLPGGAVLRRVFPSRIIVEQNGELANLYLAQSPAVPDVDDDTPVRTAKSTNQPAVTPQAGAGGRREDIQQRLEELQQRLRSNQ